MRFGAVIFVLLTSTTATAQQFATVTTNAPIYATAQETPTPLRVAAVGSRLRVIATPEGDWVQVEFNDPQLGLRTGWVLRHYISLTSSDLRPMDLSVPDAPGALPTPLPTPPPVPAPLSRPPQMYPQWETAFGWPFLRASGEILNFNSALGWHASVAGNVSPYVGIVGDVTGNYKGESTVTGDPGVTTLTFLGGPRFSARTEATAVPFAEFLVGFTRTSLDTGGLSASSTEFTIQPGGGVDIGNERAAARLSVAWRRVFYEGSPTNMFRFVAGVVIRR